MPATHTLFKRNLFVTIHPPDFAARSTGLRGTQGL